MNEYMVEITLPNLTEEIISLIPGQRIFVNELLSNGKIKTYALAAAKSKIWSIVVARNEDEVLDILESFPIYEHIDFEIISLSFSNTAYSLPQLSLN